MYTATMRYEFKSGHGTEGAEAWKDIVLSRAAAAPGLVRMQLLTSESTALAIGTWQDKRFAEDFMRTGVFKELMEAIEPMLRVKPAPELWTLAAFIEGES